MTASAPRLFALWAVPAPSDRRWLSKLIVDFSREYETPIFEPHVTLYSGLTRSSEPIETTVQQKVNGLSQFRLQVAGLRYTNTFFRSGFIQFEPNEALGTLSQSLGASLQQPYALDPHLSLLYKDMPLEQKRLAMRRIIVSVQTIAFDTLTIVEPGPEGWTDIHSWTNRFKLLLAH